MTDDGLIPLGGAPPGAPIKPLWDATGSPAPWDAGDDWVQVLDTEIGTEHGTEGSLANCAPPASRALEKRKHKVPREDWAGVRAFSALPSRGHKPAPSYLEES